MNDVLILSLEFLILMKHKILKIRCSFSYFEFENNVNILSEMSSVYYYFFIYVGLFQFMNAHAPPFHYRMSLPYGNTYVLPFNRILKIYKCVEMPKQ